MPDKRLFSITSKLLSRTLNGKVQWEPDVSGTGFRTSYPDYSVTVRRTQEPSSIAAAIVGFTGGYELIILDGEGKIVDALSLTNKNKEFTELQNLYEVARRNARGVDKALDDILKHLSD